MKSRSAGAHILSGNVLEPRALHELLPDWKEQGAPLNVPASDDRYGRHHGQSINPDGMLCDPYPLRVQAAAQVSLMGWETALEGK